jgi:hypothetical protein
MRKKMAKIGRGLGGGGRHGDQFSAFFVCASITITHDVRCP